MPLLELQLDPTQERRLAERAALSGKDVGTFLRELVQRELERPTFAEVFKPIQDACAGHAMSEEEVLVFLEAEREAMWAERKQIDQQSRDNGKKS